MSTKPGEKVKFEDFGVEAIAALMTLRDGVIPPTINYDAPDPECDLDYIPHKGREQKVDYAMSNSFAFGGLNTVLVFGPNPTG
ncbi:MAG: hypothetical protein AAFR23_08655 [Pseudomonadota bacterium]